MSRDESNLKSIGALWDKGRFMAGTIDVTEITGKIGILVFKNNNAGGNQPEFRILTDPDDQRMGGTVTVDESWRTKGSQGQEQASQQPVRDAVADDEIPF